MIIAFGLEYDGTNYHGWQAQQDVSSIQHPLETAITKVANHPIKVICAGRTDAGVHALEQVVHFETDVDRRDRGWVLGTNTHLPNDIRVLWAKKMPDDFHARFSATHRHYQYRIYNREVRSAVMHNYTSWVLQPLDENKMQQAAEFLIGKHDFNAYRASECQAKSPVRTVSKIDINRRGDMITIDISANAFLHHMVRNIAGVLIEIGKGHKPVEWSKEVLDSKDRNQGAITAPANGLFLTKIDY